MSMVYERVLTDIFLYFYIPFSNDSVVWLALYPYVKNNYRNLVQKIFTSTHIGKLKKDSSKPSKLKNYE